MPLFAIVQKRTNATTIGLSALCQSELTHCNMIGTKRKTASRRSFRNPIRCFD